jgi:hypothetical protein
MASAFCMIGTLFVVGPLGVVFCPFNVANAVTAIPLTAISLGMGRDGYRKYDSSNGD